MPITLGDITITETLPALVANFDHEVIHSWDNEDPQLLDMMIESGTINLMEHTADDPSTLVPTPIAWARSAPDNYDTVTVLIDAPRVTETILTALWIMGVIGK